MIGTDQVQARLGQVIQSMAQEAGFAVTLAPTEFVTALARQDAGNYDSFAIGWSGRIDPDGNIYQFVHSKGSLNNLGWSSPRMDLLLDNARKATTMRARRTLYSAAYRILRSQLPRCSTSTSAAGQPARREPQRPRRANLRRRPDPRLQRPVHPLTRGRRSWASSSSGSSGRPDRRLPRQRARLRRGAGDPRRSRARLRGRGRDPEVLAAIGTSTASTTRCTSST